jgi:hypothetical protein
MTIDDDCVDAGQSEQNKCVLDCSHCRILAVRVFSINLMSC